MRTKHWKIELGILWRTTISCLLSCCIILYPFLIFLGSSYDWFSALLSLVLGFIVILPFVLGAYLPIIFHVSKRKNELRIYILTSSLIATISGAFLLIYSNYALASPGENVEFHWKRFAEMLSFFSMAGLIHGYIHYKFTSKLLEKVWQK